jgi:alpha-1,6-mannosyltransferase
VKADQAAVATRYLAGLGFCGAVLIALSLVARHGQWTDDFDIFIPAAYAQGVVYAAGAWVVLQARFAALDRRVLIVLIVAVAVGLRLIALATPPNFLSTDVYRYIWDGRVQGAGINPYLYVPADPALTYLRDETNYPHMSPVTSAPTIYAPFAQMMFFVITRFGQSVTTMRLGMLGFETVTVLALALLLRRLGQPQHRLYLYLWHPLPLWEIACGAHVDAMLTAMALLALVAAMAGRRGWSGALLGAATLTKFFPLVIASALYRRWDWKMPLAFFAVTVGLYGFYAWFGGGGWRIFGSLPAYVSDEGFESGRGVFILTILRAVGLPRLPATLGFLAIAFAVMGTLFLRALSRDRPDHSMPVLAAAFAAAAVVLISPHYPWYFVWITAFNCLVPRFSLIYLTCAAFFLYVTESSTSLTTGFVLYGPFLILLLFELRRFVAPLIQEGSTS